MNRALRLKRFLFDYRRWIWLPLLLMILWTLLPIMWILISSVSPRAELYSIPPHWIPDNFTLNAYEKTLISGEGFRGGEGISAAELFRGGIYNSLFISLATTFLVMFFAPLLGYAFSRLDFPGKNIFFFAIIGIIALPGWPLLIGLFHQFKILGLLDRKLGIILLSFTFRLPFETWFMRGYFASVPREIEDAARIDGCTHLQTLLRISLHMVRPGLIAVSMISFLFSWNMFIAPQILTYTLRSKPLTVTMTEYIAQYYIHWDLLSAGAILAIIPPLIIIGLFQRYIIRGLTAGAIK